jgi:hypothetical protein
MADGKSDSSTGKGPGLAWETLTPLLGAVVTGVGLLAFVALFGGAILWDRFDHAGLPGTEAVALVPRSLLLATGAYFLIGALVLSVLAVVVLWLTDRFLRNREERIAETALEVAESTLEEDRPRAAGEDQEPVGSPTGDEPGEIDGASGHPPEPQEQSPLAVRKAALVVAEAIDREKQARTVADNARKAHIKALEVRGVDHSETLKELETADEALQEREEQVRQAKEDLDNEVAKSRTRRSLVGRSVLLGTLLLFGEWVLLVTKQTPFEVGHYGILLGVSLLTSSLAVTVYQATRKFAWFGVAAFLAVAIFQAVATHVAIISRPMVEPAAVLIVGEPPVKGVFITQTGDRLYLGIRVGFGKSTTMVAFPRNKVTSFAVGRLTRAGSPANKLADRLVAVLCSRVPKATTVRVRRTLPQCAEQGGAAALSP